MKVRSIVISMLAVEAVFLGYMAFAGSCTYNEEGHLASGLVHVRTGDFSAFVVNPPLARMVAALPLLGLDAKSFEPYSVGREAAIHQRQEYAAGRSFLEDNPRHWMRCLQVGRVSCVVFALAGSIFSYRWAAQCYGRSAGLVAAVVWGACPYVLGHGCLVGCDVAAGAVGVAAVYCFWRWLKSPQWLEAMLAGVVLGLAELCKFTLLVFYPLLPTLWVIYRLPERKAICLHDWLRQGAMVGAILLVSVYIINCGYLFEDTLTPLEKFRFQSLMFTGYDSLKDIPPEGANRFVGRWLGKLPVPLPANMVQGIDTQRYDFERGLASYLRGEWADHGWWYYYVYALAIKIPLGTWCLLALAISVTVFGRGYNASWRDEMVVFAPGLAILMLVSSQTGFSVHSRYVIPSLPFFFIWGTKVARVFEMRRPRSQSEAGHFNPPSLAGGWEREVAKGPHSRKDQALVAMVIVALAWSVASSLWAYPHSLSYFNELVGGPRNGGKHLLDSNIDWGQDLLYLKGWLAKHPEVRLDGLAYWGSYPAELAGVPETPHPPGGPQSDCGNANRPVELVSRKQGWYALSVNYLYDRSRQCRYFLCFKPVAMAGYSIYIYHISASPADYEKESR